MSNFVDAENFRFITKGENMMSKDSNFARVFAGRWVLALIFVFCGAALFCSPNVQAATGKAANLKAATYVGTEMCATCHETEYKEFKSSTHAKISIDDTQGMEGIANGCEMCHGPGSIHAEAGGGKDTMINLRKDPETCFKCHTDKKIQFKLPYRHPVLEGKMSCADCHNPHGTAIKPGASASLEGINDTCLKCHNDKQGPFVFEHEALRDGCITCHQVHGSVNDKMLTQRDNNLCLKCHTQTNFPSIGKTSHISPSRLPQGACFSAGCHTAMHGSNFDDHLRY